MMSILSRGGLEGGFLGRLRKAALVAVLVGAGSSVVLMLRAGRVLLGVAALLWRALREQEAAG